MNPYEQHLQRLAGHNKTLMENNQRLADANLKLQQQLEEATALLMGAYWAGHREGWQDGPTSAQVFDEVSGFLNQWAIAQDVKLEPNLQLCRVVLRNRVKQRQAREKLLEAARRLVARWDDTGNGVAVRAAEDALIAAVRSLD